MRVLLVDDDRTSLKIMERNLQNWGHNVVIAQDGDAALKRLGEDDHLCVLVTGWQMEGLDGLALCRKARALDRELYLFIILTSTRDAKSDLLEGMDAGADAFLHEPYDLHELRAHLQVASRIVKLERHLEDKILELDRTNSTLRSEIEAAGKIQRSLLPHQAPVVKNLSISWLFEACGATAGDMLNVVRLDEFHLGLYVLDVSGHGCQAALLSVSLSRVLNPYPQQGGILKEFTETGRRYRIPSPAEVAGILNRRFPVMKQSGQFFTFIYGILDLRDLNMTYVRAGHGEPLLHRNGHIQTLSCKPALPIGIMDYAVYVDFQVQLEPGDTVLFFSDGFEEAKNELDLELGRDTMKRVLRGRRVWDVKGAITALKQCVTDFTREMPQADDMTMVGFSIDRDETFTDKPHEIEQPA